MPDGTAAARDAVRIRHVTDYVDGILGSAKQANSLDLHADVEIFCAVPFREAL